MNYSNNNDNILLTQYVANADEQILNKLLEKYYPIIYGYTYSKVKEEAITSDITQQVLEKLYASLKKNKVENIRYFTLSITKNTIIDHFRKAKFEKSSKEKFSNNLETIVENQAEIRLSGELDRDRTENQLLECIDQLPTNQRECIKYFYFEELSYKEIAERSSFSFNEIKSYIQIFYFLSCEYLVGLTRAAVHLRKEKNLDYNKLSKFYSIVNKV